jgi:hypothetical protein
MWRLVVSSRPGHDPATIRHAADSEPCTRLNNAQAAPKTAIPGWVDYSQRAIRPPAQLCKRMFFHKIKPTGGKSQILTIN